MADFHLI